MKDYYTVTEYATVTGKDPGNIRRLLCKGILPGEKLGKQWIIPKGTIYPTDRRVRSGDYRNWRKRAHINHSAPHLIHKLTEMSEKIATIYGDALDKIILYGSYARGEQTEGSDVDIAILIKGDETEAMHDKMLDLVVDYELLIAVTLSVVSIEYDNYIKWQKVLPFYKNIDKEGIVLWKTA